MELKIEKQTAKRLYDEAPEWFQKELVNAFGTESFVKFTYTDIKSFEDACIHLGISHDVVLFGATDDDHVIAYKKLVIIIRAINQGWKPDWNNGSERKWWPWFKMSSGFGFVNSDYGYSVTNTAVGSRLCFETKEQSDYCATQFIDLYKQFLL
jgi:hypothetical protein